MSIRIDPETVTTNYRVFVCDECDDTIKHGLKEGYPLLPPREWIHWSHNGADLAWCSPKCAVVWLAREEW